MTLKEQFETAYQDKLGIERYCMLKLGDDNYYLTQYSEWLEAEHKQLEFQLRQKLSLSSISDEEIEKLIDACKTVVNDYEGDGMEGMQTRDYVFYNKCKEAIKEQ